MATQTEVTIDGVSLGKPLNNRVDGFWELSYYVKTDNGEYIFSQEYGSEEEINGRVSILRQHSKVISWLWIVEPQDTDNEGIFFMEFEDSLTDINGDSVGKK